MRCIDKLKDSECIIIIIHESFLTELLYFVESRILTAKFSVFSQAH